MFHHFASTSLSSFLLVLAIFQAPVQMAKRKSLRSQRVLQQKEMPNHAKSTDSLAVEDSVVVGPSGVRLARLSAESLRGVLQELGVVPVSCSSETIEKARRMLRAKKVPLLHHLPDAQVESLLESFIVIRQPKDAIIFEPGSVATDFWIIAEGEVEE
ncbi:unnamed protein product, partial [Prorocentrum cordatum]